MTTAILTRRNRVVCVGHSQRRTHPIQARFGRNPWSIYLHAEVDCIIKAQRLGLDISTCTMTVVRHQKDGTPTMARPCEGCQKALLWAKPKAVYYTNWKGSVCKYEI